MNDAKHELVEAAIRMGYRLVTHDNGKSLYMKPLGFSLLSLDVENRTIAQWFAGAANNDLRCWNCVDLTEADALHAIKHFESEGCRLTLGRSDSEFDFLDGLQLAERMLEGRPSDTPTTEEKEASKKKCPECSGSGKLDKDYQIFDCPWCGGMGVKK